MSVTSILKKLRETLGVVANDDVLPAVKALQQPKPMPITLAVTWTPGTPELQATINVLSDGRVPFPALSATLRAGLAVMDYQMAQRAVQLQTQLQQAMAEKETSETE